MKPDRNILLLAFVTLAVLPFAVWTALAVTARFWNATLRPMLPWLRGARWVLWIVGIPIFFVGLFYRRPFWLFVGAGLTDCSIGLAFAEGWVKRRYAPELLSPFEKRWLASRK